MSEIKITGEWDGEPIWRYETAEERLLKALNLHGQNTQSTNGNRDALENRDQPILQK